jgi:hypothetical protein
MPTVAVTDSSTGAARSGRATGPAAAEGTRGAAARAVARHAGQAAQATVTHGTAASPSPSTTQSAFPPGYGSAMPARATGNTPDSAIATSVATTAPVPPMTSARPRAAASSWRRLIPTPRSAG